MKRFLCFLIACLTVLSVPAFALDGFQYQNETLGISFTIPELTAGEIVAEEAENNVRFFHEPSKEQWGGLIGTMTVVSPRSLINTPEYSRGDYRILAIGKDQAVLWQSVTGGANSGGAQLEGYTKAVEQLAFARLKESVTLDSQESLPELHSNFLYLETEGQQIRPDDALTRGELARMLYMLLSPGHKTASEMQSFPDEMDDSVSHAAAYLASYGILNGYSDGTFQPERPVSRAEFAVLLHRCQFAPPVGRYGNSSDFIDVPEGYWAEDYIYSAQTLGWLNGYEDGSFHPNGQITRAGAVTAINRMLGQDKSATPACARLQTFTDLPDGHWARANLLYAAGYLDESDLGVQVPDDATEPEKANYTCYPNATYGWATYGKQLFQLSDGGKACTEILWDWDALGLTAFRAQFPTDQSALDAITDLELRPANAKGVYLTIRYQPYEAIYSLDFEAMWQTVLPTP